MKYNFFRFANLAIVCACMLLMFACGNGDNNSPNPNDDPKVDLSYLYIQSVSEQTEYYTYEGSVMGKTPEYKSVLTYDGHKIIKLEWYVDGKIEHIDNYTYDGLTATVTDNNGDLVRIIEYADDTYLREKNRWFADGARIERVYDGAKLISAKEYDPDNKLVYDQVFVYDGLTANIVENRYKSDGTLRQTFYYTRTYLDETFLRVVSDEVRVKEYSYDYNLDDYNIASYVYDGTKLVMVESKYVLSNGEEWVSFRQEREYDGLKCREKKINYNRDGRKEIANTREIQYLEW